MAAFVAVAAAGLTLAPAPVAADVSTTVIAAGSTWRYHDGGTDLGTAWRAPGHDDASWKQGPTEIGYGDGDEATKVTGHRSTYYLRRSFAVADAATVTALQLRTVVDDGAVVYLNGTEIWRTNVAQGQTYKTLATTYVAGAAEKAWTSTAVPKAALVTGTNVLAVEVHNDALSSSDISFNAELTATETTGTEPGEAPVTMCRIDHPALRELSGAASSVRFPGILWMHNDSGDSARIFAVDSATCAVRATVTLSGITARDFESISVGRDESGRPEIWVGDTGDNGLVRSNVKLYRFVEPTTLTNQSVAVRTVTVTWSDGRRDSEGLIVEPVPGGRVFLVTRETVGGMYQLRGDFRATGVATTGARLMNLRAKISDAATSPDRSITVIRALDDGTLLVGLPGSSPRSVWFPHQTKGEAVTFSLDGRYLFLTSEGVTDLIRVPVSWL